MLKKGYRLSTEVPVGQFRCNFGAQMNAYGPDMAPEAYKLSTEASIANIEVPVG